MDRRLPAALATGPAVTTSTACADGSGKGQAAPIGATTTMTAATPAAIATSTGTEPPFGGLTVRYGDVVVMISVARRVRRRPRL